MTRKGRIHVGTSGWSYPHWVGPFYPEDLPDDGKLRFYADRLESVEINNSFYHLPEEHTLAAWRDAVPDGFVFAVKASRYITHMKKLKDPDNALHRLLERVRVLGDGLGPLLFQLPPSWHRDTERLDRFLELLDDEEIRCAFEFRDHSWLDAEIYEVLRRHRAAFCIHHLDGFLSPREVTTDLVYVRLHGPGGAYEGSYDPETLSGWAGAFSTWAAGGREVHCYFDNDDRGYAAANAVRLREMVGS